MRIYARNPGNIVPTGTVPNVPPITHINSAESLYQFLQTYDRHLRSTNGGNAPYRDAELMPQRYLPRVPQGSQRDPSV